MFVLIISYIKRYWPWVLLAAAIGTAIWHDVDFPEDVDPEFPSIARTTFSRRPPPAYRLAEPGDTIDRVELYLAALAVILATTGLGTALVQRLRDRSIRVDLWISAWALSTAAIWHASTPGPTFDRWHGLGPRTILDPAAPISLRIALAGAALILLLLTLTPFLIRRRDLSGLWRIAGERSIRVLLIVAAILGVLRQFEIPGIEPVGYWPRFSIVFSLLLWCCVLAQSIPLPKKKIRAAAWFAAATFGWLFLVRGGLEVTWLHRPLHRFREIENGRIYISAMPTYRGLEEVNQRHHFKTIINLFPEDTPLRSPILPDEIRFAREHNIRYVGSPSDASSADAFLELTLKLARDPDAWPILVHCHGCQDRTPAWVGIYRFLFKGDSLTTILRDYERWRGYVPKASVTLLYNRVLAQRAGERFAADPVSKILAKAAAGVQDPYYDQLEYERGLKNKQALKRLESNPKGSEGTRAKIDHGEPERAASAGESDRRRTTR